MNIGFDGKRAANNLTGLGNYSRSLIGQLALFFRQNQYFVYTPKVKHSKQISSFFEDEKIHLKLPEKSSISFLWRSFFISRQLKKDNIDIYHGLSAEIPFGISGGKTKTVVTIHDLIFRRFPQHFKAIDRFIYNFKSKYACKHADLIVAISKRTKQDIIDCYAIPPEKITVVYQSCDDSFKKPADQALKAAVRLRYNLPEKFILNVGTIEPRKNLLALVQAMKDIHNDYTLVVVGKPKAYARLVIAEIERLGLQKRILFLRDIPFTDLPAIYQLAAVFVYPSFYEGFGIPVIEALYSEVPVVAATGSCLEEAGGPDSKYAGPNDTAAISAAVNAILDQPDVAADMIASGLRYVQRFDTGVVAAQLMNCYTNISPKA
jgi:glycosyltransferase involved in cell wall biosynthesis